MCPAGDAISSTVAPPFSTTVSSNVWAMYCNRSASSCLNLNNVTLVVPTQEELNYQGGWRQPAFKKADAGTQQLQHASTRSHDPLHAAGIEPTSLKGALGSLLITFEVGTCMRGPPWARLTVLVLLGAWCRSVHVHYVQLTRAGAQGADRWAHQAVHKLLARCAVANGCGRCCMPTFSSRAGVLAVQKVVLWFLD